MLATDVAATIGVGVKVGRRVLDGSTVTAESCNVVEASANGVADASTTAIACGSKLVVGVRSGKTFLIRMVFEVSAPREHAREARVNNISIQTIGFGCGSLDQ